MKRFKVTIIVRDEATSLDIQAGIKSLWGVEHVLEPEMLEPEWKRKVRRIIAELINTTIDDFGVIHGRLYTENIRSILSAGGLLMVHYDGEVVVSNWED